MTTKAASAPKPKTKKLTKKQLRDAAIDRIAGEESAKGWKVIDNPITTTKKAWVQLSLREAPRSLDDLALLIGVSKPAAQALIGDLRRAGERVNFDKARKR